MKLDRNNLLLDFAAGYLVIITIIIVIGVCKTFGEIGSTATPQFTWDPSTSSNSVGRYELHFGPLGRTTNDPLYARNYTSTNVIPRFASSAVLLGIHPGIWFMSVTAVGTNGIASVYSNEVCYTNRGEAPANLRIVGPTEVLVIESTFGPAEQWHKVIEFDTNTPPALRPFRFSELFRAARRAPAPPAPVPAPAPGGAP